MTPFIDLAGIIIATGYLGLITTIFLESGTVVGFFLPGDSLLFTAGFLASQNIFSIELLLLFLIPAAILGDVVGYWTGHAFGPRLFTKPQSFFFKPQYLEQAHAFFLKYGARAIFFARFVPVIRCFVPIVAGAANMPYRGFLFYNIFGGFVWVGSITLLGYFLGRSVPNAERYLLPIIIVIVLVSMTPPLIHFLRARKNKDTEVL